MIELLVVIAIIAILAALLLPALSRTKAQGLSTQCMSNTKQLTLGWLNYANDNQGYLTPNGDALAEIIPDWLSGRGFGFVPPTSNAVQYAMWTLTQGLLYPYAKNVMVFQCPAESKNYQSNLCLPFPNVRNYSMSRWMNGYPSDMRSGANMKEADIQHPPPARAFVFIHESYSTLLVCSFTVNPTGRVWLNEPTTIHLNGDNLSFADGHVEHWTWHEQNTFNLVTSVVGFDETPVVSALSPTDKDFDRVAAAYSTPPAQY